MTRYTTGRAGLAFVALLLAACRADLPTGTPPGASGDRGAAPAAPRFALAEATPFLVATIDPTAMVDQRTGEVTLTGTARFASGFVNVNGTLTQRSGRAILRGGTGYTIEDVVGGTAWSLRIRSEGPLIFGPGKAFAGVDFFAGDGTTFESQRVEQEVRLVGKR